MAVHGRTKTMNPSDLTYTESTATCSSCVDTRSTPSGDPDLHLDGEDQEPDDIASPRKVSI